MYLIQVSVPPQHLALFFSHFQFVSPQTSSHVFQREARSRSGTDSMRVTTAASVRLVAKS